MSIFLDGKEFKTSKEWTSHKIMSGKKWMDDIGITGYALYHTIPSNSCGKCSHLDQTFEPLEVALNLESIPFSKCGNKKPWGCSIVVQCISEQKYLKILNSEH